MVSKIGEFSGKVRSTPTPKETLRTVKVRPIARTVDADHDALEDLDTRAAALDDLHVDLDGVTGAEGRDVVALVDIADLGKDVGHVCSSRVPQVSRGFWVVTDSTGPRCGRPVRPLWQVRYGGTPVWCSGRPWPRVDRGMSLPEVQRAREIARGLVSTTAPGGAERSDRNRKPAFLYIRRLAAEPAPVNRTYDVTSGGRGLLDQLEQGATQSPALEVGGDHDPADVPLAPVVHLAADGTEQPARGRFAGDEDGPLPQPAAYVVERLVERRDVHAGVGLELLEPAGALQGVELARVGGHRGTDVEVGQGAGGGAGRHEVGTPLGPSAPPAARGATRRSVRGRPTAARRARRGRARRRAWCRRGTPAARPRGTPRRGTRRCP